MKARIYQFIILLLQFVCGGLVMKSEWLFLFDLLVIILPISIVGGFMFFLHNREIIKQYRKEETK